MEYLKWLKGTRDKAIKREDDQMLNYQETGNPRYERAQREAEYLARALNTAIATEEGRNEKVESLQRRFAGVMNEFEKAITGQLTDQAVAALKGMIQVHKLLGL